MQSEYGKGSEFKVELPFALGDNTQKIEWRKDNSECRKCAESKSYDFSGKHILLAEDNELNREIAVQLLGDVTGAQIDEAEDGRKAAELFAQSELHYYDLILMDIQMPRMNGFEATKVIRSLPRPDAATVPIVAMTANAFAEDEEKSRKAGMNAHLSKPLEIPAVLATMNKFMNSD